MVGKLFWHWTLRNGYGHGNGYASDLSQLADVICAFIAAHRCDTIWDYSWICSGSVDVIQFGTKVAFASVKDCHRIVFSAGIFSVRLLTSKTATRLFSPRIIFRTFGNAEDYHTIVFSKNYFPCDC